MGVGAIIGLILGGIILLALLFLAVSYKKVPPHQIAIVSGVGKMKVVRGKAIIKIPFLQRMDHLELNVIQIDIRTDTPVPNREFIDINVDAVANIKIDSRTTQSINLASEIFLSKTREEIKSIATEVLEGNMREIIGQMELTELVHNRDAFAEKVKTSADEDMAKMGLEIINITIQNFTDNNGVISDLGVDNVSKIKKIAAIAKAEADKDVAVAVSAARKEANDARVKSETEISRRNNELDIEKAKLKTISQAEIAIADAAYRLETVEQNKRVVVAEVESDIEKTTKQAVLAEERVRLTEQELSATVRKVVDAEKYRMTVDAEARAEVKIRDASARQEVALREAEAIKSIAEARAIEKQAEARGIQAIGEAEAKAIADKAASMAILDHSGRLELILSSNVIPNTAQALAKAYENSNMTFYGQGAVTGLMETNTQQLHSLLQMAKDSGITDIFGGVVKNQVIADAIVEHGKETSKPQKKASDK